MITGFADPFDVVLNLQRALEARLASGWLQDSTTSLGPFPPINVFQQGEDIFAIIELPGSKRAICASKRKKTPFGYRAGSPSIFPKG
jgi:HSP20 family protein